MAARVDIDTVNAQVNSILNELKMSFVSPNTNVSLPVMSNIQVSTPELDVIKDALKQGSNK
ncbi:MAG: hypothetical protein NTZ10_03795 [Candidatus Saganbacteria bacterium]|nr:hypothetical protein [Candidatus Saganbacteria bacterium]